jgi:hypothetical protein
MFGATFRTRTGAVEREAAPGGEKRMSQPKRWGGDWRSEGERTEYLNGGVGRGGGDVEHVPGWGADGNERAARKGEQGGGCVRGRGET